MVGAAPHVPSPTPLVPGAVHVWRGELDGVPADHRPLSRDERERGARLRDERGRSRFLASRAWLRSVLAPYLAVDPGALRFAVAERGKPSIVGGGDVGFSLSRSAGVALVAVTRGRAVGVDVERVRADLGHDRLAGQLFSPAEAAALRELTEPDRQEAFFRLWVRKEAVVKASGVGLADGVDHLDVRGDTVAGRWAVAPLDAGPGFAAAVAVDGVLGPVSLRTWPLRA